MTKSKLSKIDFANLPGDAKNRKECLQDIFGLCLIDARSTILESAKIRVASEQGRADLGAISRRIYQDVAHLDAASQNAALRLSEQCIDNFAMLVLALLANRGTDLQLSSGEAIRFALKIEVIDVPSGRDILQEVISDAGFLPDRYGRWKNRYGGSDTEQSEGSVNA